nr:unnamed protein product [Callosobruchus analis]CAI5842039.1 unnamed protein product [Callosobruchus analis]
MENLEFSTA